MENRDIHDANMMAVDDDNNNNMSSDTNNYDTTKVQTMLLACALGSG